MNRGTCVSFRGGITMIGSATGQDAQRSWSLRAHRRIDERRRLAAIAGWPRGRDSGESRNRASELLAAMVAQPRVMRAMSRLLTRPGWTCVAADRLLRNLWRRLISAAGGLFCSLHHDEGWRLHQPAIPRQGGLHASGMWPSTAASRAGSRQPSYEWRVPCLPQNLPALTRKSPGEDSSLPLPRR